MPVNRHVPSLVNNYLNIPSKLCALVWFSRLIAKTKLSIRWNRTDKFKEYLIILSYFSRAKEYYSCLFNFKSTATRTVNC